MYITITDSGHGHNREIQGRQIALPEVYFPEILVAVVAQPQAPNPCIPFLGLRQGGGEIVEYAGSRVRVIQLDNNKLHNPRKQIINANVLLHFLKEASHFPHPAQSNPQEVPHFFLPPTELVDEIPREAAEEVENEARPEVAEGNGCRAVDHAVGTGVAVGEVELDEDVGEECNLAGDVEEE